MLVSTGLGSTLSMIGGTFEVYNNAANVAEGFSTLNLIAHQPEETDGDPVLTIDGKEANQAKVKVKPKSKAVATTIRAANDNDAKGNRLVGDMNGGDFENSGSTTVTNKTQLTIASTAKNDAGCYTQKAVLQNGQVVEVPVMTLETASVIMCGALGPQGYVGDFNIEAGDLDIINREGDDEPSTAEINSRVVALWPDATLNMLGEQYNTLYIVGKFSWMGKLNTAISASTDQADLVKVTGKVGVAKASAKLKAYWGDSTTLKPYQREWLLVKSLDDTINNELDPTRINFSELDPRIKTEHLSRTQDNTVLYLHPYITPFV